MDMPPPLGTVDYAIWAYMREMERARADEVRKSLETGEGESHG